MKNVFGKSVLGLLLASLCALAAYGTGSASATVPAQTTPAQSIDGRNVSTLVADDQAIGQDWLGEQGMPVSLNSCLAQCGDDFGCRHCCVCNPKPNCCF